MKIERIVRAAAIIFGIYAVCEAIRIFVGIPIPGNVLGMVVLFVLLCTGVVKRETFNEISHFVLNNMTLMFIPGATAIFAYFGIIAESAWQYVVVVVVSSFFIILLTGKSADLLKRGPK